MKKALLVEIITYFFILLFLYTGIAKLLEIHQFKEQLISSPLMGTFAGFVTWTLPLSELILAIALFIPAFRLKALYITLVLMTLFTAYVLTIFLIDNQISCSCGGVKEDLSPKQHILFNIACVILSALAIAMFRSQQSTLQVKWLTGATITAVFLGIGWILFTPSTTPSIAKTGMEGRLLPSFDILLPDSVTHFNTAKIPTGKPFIVFGFQPSCTHCQAETRAIIENMQQLKNIHIYYVTPYPFSQMKAFYKYFKLAQYPNVTIGTDPLGTFFIYFQTSHVPYTAVFDSQKRLKKAFISQTDALSLVRAIGQ